MVDPAILAETGPKTTFDIEWFLGTTAGGEGTRKNYRHLLERMQTLMGRPLAEATPRNVDNLKVELRQFKSGLQMVRLLRGFYQRCGRASFSPEQRFRFEQLADTAVMKLKRPRMDPNELLTPDDVVRLMNAALSLRDRALFGVLYETGCRITEALVLDWSNVTLQPATPENPEMYAIFFPKVKVSGAEHSGWVIDTAGPLKAWIEQHPTQSGPFFCTHPGDTGEREGRALTRGGAWRRLKDAARRAGIEKRVHPHSFRHARATHLLNAGWSEPRVKALLGWSPSSRMLDRYSHLNGGDVRRALLERKGFATEGAAPTFTWKESAVPAVPVKAVYGAALPRRERVPPAICPGCKASNPGQAAFCMECGAQLKTPRPEGMAALRERMSQVMRLLRDPAVIAALDKLPWNAAPSVEP